MPSPSCLADLWALDAPLKLAVAGPQPAVIPALPYATGDGLAQVSDEQRAMFGAALGLVRRWGVPVMELDGWEQRGRPTPAAYAGAVDHHTGGPAWSTPSQWWAMTALVRDGRSDLNGPLSQVCTWPDSTLVVVAVGVSNHAGPGGWAGLRGNAKVLGNELVHSGGPNEPWPVEQLRTALLWDAACAMSFDFGAHNVCEHKEWSDAGKIDRIGIDGDERRRALADVIASGGPTPDLSDRLAAIVAATC